MNGARRYRADEDPNCKHVPYTSARCSGTGSANTGRIQISDVSTLIPIRTCARVLEDQDIAALIAAPFWRNGEMTGFVGLDYTRAHASFCPRKTI